MKRGEGAAIPFDLVIEILSRLPAKSVARFRGVSKLWCSMLHRPYFTELFLTRQRARPLLLFFLTSPSKEYSFYSSHQTPNPYKKSFYSRFHMKFSPMNMWSEFVSCLTSGLMYFYSRHDDGVLCNPNTRQYAILPSLKKDIMPSYSFLGFDPIGKQFKVLFLAGPYYGLHEHKILTLVNGILRRRKILCPFIHSIYSESICINGVLYYSARKESNSDGIVCFDVRSETFKFVDKDPKLSCEQLINYKGKLGGIKLEKTDGGFELSLWVLQDVEKQEWSNDVYTLDEDIVDALKKGNIDVVGVAATGEIVFANNNTCKPFYVFYYNLERKTLQSVEIQGLGEYHNRSERVITFVDHVEDLDIIDAAKHRKSNQGLKIITKRPKPHRPTPTPPVKKSTIKVINQYELLNDLE